jgi:hypothetical protein
MVALLPFDGHLEHHERQVTGAPRSLERARQLRHRIATQRAGYEQAIGKSELALVGNGELERRRGERRAVRARLQKWRALALGQPVRGRRADADRQRPADGRLRSRIRDQPTKCCALPRPGPRTLWIRVHLEPRAEDARALDALRFEQRILATRSEQAGGSESSDCRGSACARAHSSPRIPTFGRMGRPLSVSRLE